MHPGPELNPIRDYQRQRRVPKARDVFLEDLAIDAAGLDHAPCSLP
jgi:hypothetical protein